MYSMYVDEYVLYDPRDESRKIRETAAHLAVGEAGTLSFTIDNNHPELSRLTKMKSIITLYDDASIIFKGRIVKDTKDFDNARKVECEGLLACLNDTIVAPHVFPDDFSPTGNVVSYYLTWLLTQHNQNVTNNQKIYAGTIDVTTPGNTLAFEVTDYKNTWESVQYLQTMCGGHLIVRYESGNVYLDYLSSYSSSNTQKVMYAENLLDLSTEVNSSDIYTHLCPVGVNNLTIDTEPDGQISGTIYKSGKFVYDTALVSSYGRIEKYISYGDIDSTLELKNKAVSEIANAGLAQTITVSACDLHYADSSTPTFKVGMQTTIVSLPHSMNATYPLSELDIDILDPSNTTITLGEKKTTQTDINIAFGRQTSQKGQPGEDGRSISTVVNYYNVQDKTILTPPTTGWTTNLASLSWDATKYIWRKEQTSYSQGSPTESTPYIDKSLATVALWCALADQTKIDGGNIFAHTITSNALNTDAIKSLNYVAPSSASPYSQAGTFLNLAHGEILSKNFGIDLSGNAYFAGNVTATGGDIGPLSVDTDKKLSYNVGSQGSVEKFEIVKNPNGTPVSIGFEVTTDGGGGNGASLVIKNEAGVREGKLMGNWNVYSNVAGSSPIELHETLTDHEDRIEALEGSSPTPLVHLVSVPATKTSAGTKGDIAVEVTATTPAVRWLYVCYDTNKWGRVELNNF